jgi:L-lysine exporter family protein LysE/ArgO
VTPTASIAALLSGLGAGLSLIVAIGAQNAFVLRQGLRREHVLPIVLICIVSDAVLMLLGVAGIGGLTQAAPLAVEILRWAGAGFLLVYAVFSARRALHPARLETVGPDGGMKRLAAILTCLSITWLNPHVYLDTVVLLGSLASSQGADGRWFFAAGAVTGSVLWFSGLGYGARLLAPVFAKPAAWRVLDGAISVFMIVLALTLAAGAF